LNIFGRWLLILAIIAVCIRASARLGGAQLSPRKVCVTKRSLLSPGSAPWQRSSRRAVTGCWPGP